ncbi:hypothetical protein sos41_04540 [Alphaproteobacteria bacterium SO-S41]|nr:hypothetical protein sos41_04540 [Alphaproteobacteria bacterium SO-S41]
MGQKALSFAWPVLAVLLAAGGWWLIRAPEAETPATYRAQMAARGATAPVADIAAAAQGSVYLVTIELPSGRRSPVGTAFVVARRDGTKVLATSALVADLFRRDLQANPDFNGGRMMAAQPKPPDYPALRVTGVEVHPAWDALGEAAPYWSAYGVALLLVDDPARLGPPLALARRTVLETLKAGDPVVLVGYVARDLPLGDLTRPVPSAEAGIVTALTGFDRTRGPDAANLLIQSSLEAADGAAGSPMLNAAGEVVGLFNDGDPSGLLYGQVRPRPADLLVSTGARGDLVAALLDGTAASDLPGIVAAWSTAGLDRRAAAPAPDQLVQLKARAGPDADIVMVAEREGALVAADPLFPGARAAWFDLDLPGPGLYLALARSETGARVGAVLQGPDGAIIEVGTVGALVSSCMVRSEGPASLRLGVVGDGGRVRVQLYRAARPGG